MKHPFAVNNFDLIRLVTAFLVLANHSLGHLELPVPGWYSVIQQFERVPMFFVMSGFLLSASFERNSNLRHYFTNRFTRIYPALWICLLLTVITFSVIGHADFANAATLPWLTAQMLGFIYTPSFLDSFGYGSYNGSLWTLVVELQFYLVLPIIYFVFKKFNITGKSNLFFHVLFLMSIILAFMLKAYISPPDATGTIHKLIRYSILPHTFLFIAGILLQRHKLYESKIIRGKALIWAGVFLLWVYVVPHSTFSFIIEMLILAVCTISFGYSAAGFASKVLKNRDISYGVYLYHGMLLSLLVELNYTGSWSYMLGVAIVTLLLSWWSYRLIEAPAMVWAKKRNLVAGAAKAPPIVYTPANTEPVKEPELAEAPKAVIVPKKTFEPVSTS